MGNFKPYRRLTLQQNAGVIGAGCRVTPNSGLKPAYLRDAVAALKQARRPAGDDLVRHVAPLGREHISLTGGYIWPAAPMAGPRPLREKPSMLAA